MEPIYGFDAKGAGRAADAIRYVEGLPRDATRDAEKNERRITNRRGVVTQVIEAPTATKAGLCKVRLQRTHPVTRAYENLPIAPVDCINEWLGNVTVGAMVKVEIQGNRWCIQGYFCS